MHKSWCVGVSEFVKNILFIIYHFCAFFFLYLELQAVYAAVGALTWFSMNLSLLREILFLLTVPTIKFTIAEQKRFFRSRTSQTHPNTKREYRWISRTAALIYLFIYSLVVQEYLVILLEKVDILGMRSPILMSFIFCFFFYFC